MMTEEEKIREQELTGKIQDKELLMLRDIAALFEKNGIEFWLADGTALGCVRSGGFIPWDDDVDIYIKGADYPRMQELFKTHDTGRLKLHDFSTVPGYPYWFPKIVDSSTVLVEKAMEHLDYVCGVYVDVFLLQETSDNTLLRSAAELRRYLDYCIVRLYYRAYESKRVNFLKKIVRTLFDPLKAQKALYRQYIKEGSGSRYLIDVGAFFKSGLMERSFFENKLNMDFEGFSMPVPGDTDNYLRHYYGDYMQLPPESERVSNHDFSRLVLDAGEGEII